MREPDRIRNHFRRTLAPVDRINILCGASWYPDQSRRRWAAFCNLLQFVPPNQQRQSTEGSARLGVVGYYINLYSPKNGSNTKQRYKHKYKQSYKTGNSFRRGRRCNGHPARMCRPSYYIELSAHRPLSASKSDREKQLPLRPLEI